MAESVPGSVSWENQRMATARDPDRYESDPACLSKDWHTAYQHAYSIVGNAADAEDLAQETFLRLFQYRSRIDTYVGWMKVVVRSVKHRHFAKTRPDLHVAIENDGDTNEDDQSRSRAELVLVDARESIEERVVHEDLMRKAKTVLRKLSDAERDCVMMYVKGYTFVQIATVLGISYSDAIRTTRRAVVAIRRKIAR